MTFRTRLFIAFLGAVLLPLGVLAYGVQRTLAGRVTAEHASRIGGLTSGLVADVDAEADGVGRRLAAIARELAGDTRFRLEAVDGLGEERRWLLDYAASAMQRAGFAMLQVQDSAGRILTSGHFRNEFDRLDAERLTALRREGWGVVDVRTPDRALAVIARVDSFTVGRRRFFVMGGTEIDSAFVSRLARDAAFTVSFSTGHAPRGAAAAVTLPHIVPAGAAAVEDAHLVLTEREDLLADVRRDINRWLITALALTLAAGLVLAAWLSFRVSRPLRALAERTAAIDLDRLDQEFPVERGDEIGTLSRTLGEMTGRLRSSAAQLREAERRAVVGDMSRQVTHDIKNGIAPIRHVFRHLDEVARDTPDQLAAVYGERRATVSSSIEYLDTLARNYGRLSPAGSAGACDVNAIIREVMRDVPAHGADVRAELADGLPSARGEPLAIRRVLQNLLGNAIDSLDGGSGSVTIQTRSAGRSVSVGVFDTGRGMTRDELEHAFDDFYTTKAGGTGLGLSVVRRLVADLGGTLRVETEPGAGSRFTVELPVADEVPS